LVQFLKGEGREGRGAKSLISSFILPLKLEFFWRGREGKINELMQF